MFGEIAEQYDAFRPVVSRRALRRDHRVRRRCSRATPRSRSARAPARRRCGFVARGLAVHALEPSPEMARVLRAQGRRRSRRRRSRTWPVPARRVPARVRRAGVALGARRRPLREGRRRARAGRHARVLLEQRPRRSREPFGADNDAVYARLAPAPDELGPATSGASTGSLDELAARERSSRRRAHGHVGDVVHERGVGAPARDALRPPHARPTTCAPSSTPRSAR